MTHNRRGRSNLPGRWRGQRLDAGVVGPHRNAGADRCRSCARSLAALCIGLAVVSAGCDDPGTIGRYRATPVTNIILDSLGVVDEEPQLFAGARDAEPADLVEDTSEYVIGAGDVLDVSIFELFGMGEPFESRKQVSATGRITLPVIGTFYAAGRTELELTDDIVNKLKPAILKDPKVSVVVVGSREKVYSIFGTVPAPGTYQIGGGEFRVFDALAQAGGFPQSNSDYAYVIREVPAMAEAAAEDDDWDDYEYEDGGDSEAEVADPYDRARQVQRPAGRGEAEGLVEQVAPQTEEEALLESIHPAPTVMYMSDFAVAEGQLDGAVTLLTEAEAQPDQWSQSQGPEGSALDQDDVEAGSETPKPFKVRRKGGRFVLEPVGHGDVDQTIPQVQPRPKPPERDLQGQGRADLDELGPGSPTQEVIRISLKKLRSGDLSQNIVIRPGDTIEVPWNTVGEFYVMGQVARSGGFTLTGRRLTLKHAIANAGPLTALAWPACCDITRRIGENREVTYRVNLQSLFDGTAPDVFLKPDDIVNVGSNPVSRWVAVIRQSFRATYGFGFVYDRNFADKDIGR